MEKIVIIEEQPAKKEKLQTGCREQLITHMHSRCCHWEEVAHFHATLGSYFKTLFLLHSLPLCSWVLSQYGFLSIGVVLSSSICVHFHLLPQASNFPFCD